MKKQTNEARAAFPETFGSSALSAAKKLSMNTGSVDCHATVSELCCVRPLARLGILTGRITTPEIASHQIRTPTITICISAWMDNNKTSSNHSAMPPHPGSRLPPNDS